MTMAIRGDLKGSEEVLEQGKTYIGNRTQETAKIWYVQAVIAVLVIIWLPYFLLSASMNVTDDLTEVDRFFSPKFKFLRLDAVRLVRFFHCLFE